MTARKRRPAPSADFISGLLTGLPWPFFVAVFFFIGWYFLTNYRQNLVDESIKTINTKIEAGSKLVTDQAGEEAKARAKVREDFLNSQQKTAESLSALDKSLAVVVNQQTIMSQQLGKAVDQLQNIANQQQRR